MAKIRPLEGTPHIRDIPALRSRPTDTVGETTDTRAAVRRAISIMQRLEFERELHRAARPSRSSR